MHTPSLRGSSRGQGAAEFLVVVAVVVSVISLVLLPSFGEAEVSIALAAARAAAFSHGVRNGAELAALDYERVGNEVFIKSVVYSNGTRLFSHEALDREALEAIRKTLSPASKPVAGKCVQGVFNKYCVS